MYVAQEAHFLAAVQVIVYAGAIVVLFLFVIMLLGVDKAEDLQIEPFKLQRKAAALVGGGVIGLIVFAAISSRDNIGLAKPAQSDVVTAVDAPTRTTATSASSRATCSAITCWRSSSPRCCW